MVDNDGSIAEYVERKREYIYGGTKKPNKAHAANTAMSFLSMPAIRVAVWLMGDVRHEHGHRNSSRCSSFSRRETARLNGLAGVGHFRRPDISQS